MSPPSNSFLKAEQTLQMEPFYPLKVFVCDECLLVQLPQYESVDAIFSNYIYFSSYSDSWLAHARRYVEMVIPRLELTAESRVVEVASNDGYLLQYFKNAGIPVLGIEPAGNVAEVARAKGIETVVRFFGSRAAQDLVAQRGHADLIVGNNVLAHVPDINDFVSGLATLLAPDGTITMEFPHLVHLMKEAQFDTIYHEHFSYLSLFAAERIFAGSGLAIYDVELLATHGGSLRIYACHAGMHVISPGVVACREAERAAGIDHLKTYTQFDDKVRAIKRDLLKFLVKAKEQGKSVAGYGAAAKGNTLLNYCGIRQDFVDFVVDKNPHKQGHFLPGTHLPVYAPEHARVARPDYLLVLPWNIRDEITQQMSFIRDWGGKFVVAIPEVRVIP